MKKALVFIALSFVALSACQKTTNSSTHPTTYAVQGITDVKIMGDTLSTLDLSYSVNYVGPIQETVTLSLGDLPPNIVVDTTWYYANTGIPSFVGGFRLVNKNPQSDSLVKGKYTVKLICDGSVTGRKYYTFVLNVLPKAPLPGMIHCDSALVGNWDTCMDFCDVTSTIFSNTLTVDGTTMNRIHFSNFQNYGIDVYADLDCATGTFVIPHQTFAGGAAAIWGTGSFSNNFISYSVTDSSVVGVTPCSGSVTRP